MGLIWFIDWETFFYVVSCLAYWKNAPFLIGLILQQWTLLGRHFVRSSFSPGAVLETGKAAPMGNCRSPLSHKLCGLCWISQKLPQIQRNAATTETLAVPVTGWGHWKVTEFGVTSVFCIISVILESHKKLVDWKEMWPSMDASLMKSNWLTDKTAIKILMESHCSLRNSHNV